MRALVSPAELQGLVNDLRPAIDDLAQLTDDSVELLPMVDDASRCFIENVLPAGDIVIDVPNYPHETGVENYKEFWQSQVALSGESQNFDGNGGYTRFQPGGGHADAVHRQHDPRRPADVRQPEPAVARLGPALPGAQAALPARRRVPHERASEGQRERGEGDARAMRRAIRKHLRDFIAILFLVIVAAGVAGYILSNQRFYLPAWVPGIGSDFYEVEAEFETGQAVVPGQGQTVNIAGVKVGDIGEVELEDGVAVVELKIQDKYKPIYRDAKMLLRPKTGLKDMFVELDPGTQAAGELPEGGRISLAQTRPDVNPDEILAQLDGDTRAYLQILANAGGEAFTDDPRSRTRSRTRPTCARRSSGSSRRTSTSRSSRGCSPSGAQNAKRAIHSFSQLVAGAGREGHAARRAGRVLERELPGVRRAGGEPAPGAPAPARHALDDAAHARQGRDPRGRARPRLPGAAAVRAQPRPGAAGHAPGPARHHADHPRRDPPVHADRAQPGQEAARARPRSSLPRPSRLVTAFGVINNLLDTLAYNPPGNEEGFLFWTAWANHNAPFVFNTQDAHGPIRRGNFLVDCASLTAVEALLPGLPQLEVLFELLNAPVSEEVCAQQETPAFRSEKKADDAKAASGGFD